MRLALSVAFLSFSCSLCLPGQAPPSRTPFTPTPANLAQMQQGTEAMQAGRNDEAASEFGQLTQAAPRFAEAYLNLALALSQLGRNQDAASALEKAIALKPSMRGAHLFLAISDYRLNHLEAASTAIHAETSRSPADAQAWMWQGIIALALEQNANAVEALDRAALLEPANVDILYHRGRAALELSRQSYEQMFKQDPHSWHVHQVLAEADVESGHDTDAIDEFKLAINAAPPQSGLYEALGSSYWRAGKYDEAQQAYEHALKIDPEDVVTLYKLGCLRIDRSDAANGKPLLERVLAVDSSLKMTLYYLGRAELQTGNDAAAIEDFQKAIHDHPEDDTAKQSYFQLARVYRRMHNTQASEQAQAQYRLLDAKSKTALQEKLSQRRQRGDRDGTLPVAPVEDQGEQP